MAGFAWMIKDLSGDANMLIKCSGAVDADLTCLRSFTRRDPGPGPITQANIRKLVENNTKIGAAEL